MTETIENDKPHISGIPLPEHHGIPTEDNTHEISPECWRKPSQHITTFHVIYQHNRRGDLHE